MPLHNWFVGGVSMAAGLVLAGSAAIDAAWLFALAKPRRLAESVGRKRARLILILVGGAFIALGAVIAFGYRVNWT